MTGVNDRLNWDSLLKQTYEAQPIPDKPNAYRPIPTISLFVESSCAYLMVGVKSNHPETKPWWFLGAWLSARLPISPSTLSEFVSSVETYRTMIRLGTLTLVRLPQFLNLPGMDLVPYVVTLQIPYWIKGAYVEVWVYSGENATFETASLEAIRAALESPP